MALPPRPKGRALVRRAVVASVLVAGCDQGAKPSSVPPQVAPDPEQKQQLLVPPQVAWDAEPAPVPPQVEPHESMPPQVAYAIPPKRDPPQFAYASGFTLRLVDDEQKPLAKTTVKLTLQDGTVITATTSDRGDAYIRTNVPDVLTVSISVRGYQPASNVKVGGGRHPSETVVMTKRAKR